MRGKPSITIACGFLALFFGLQTASGEPVVINSEPVIFDLENPTRTKFGILEYRGGLRLSSREARFGGFSALGISSDGARLVSLSDRGHRLSAQLIYDQKGHLQAIEQTDLSSLAGSDGRILRSKNQADVESMSPGVEGEIIVSFERNHRLMRYLPGQTTPEELPAPDGINRLDYNHGIEALTLLNDGRLLAITEGAGKAANAIGWVSDTAGWSPVTYKREDGFRVTGAATHPNGDVYVLERYYTLREGGAVRIKRIGAATIGPGAELTGRLVAEFRAPLSLDNFEGIDLRANADGRTFLYLISDDNFSPLQSTLLMMFEIIDQ